MKKSMEVIESREVLGKEFRIYGDIENPLFLAKDVAEWIEYNKKSNGQYDTAKMLQVVDADEKIKIFGTLTSTNNYRKPVIPTGSASANRWFLTEDGLYEVLMQSRMPIAKAFKKEVKKILKEIRKTGGYIPGQSEDEILANALIIAENKIKRLSESNEKLIERKYTHDIGDTCTINTMADMLNTTRTDIKRRLLDLDWCTTNYIGDLVINYPSTYLVRSGKGIRFTNKGISEFTHIYKDTKYKGKVKDIFSSVGDVE